MIKYSDLVELIKRDKNFKNIIEKAKEQDIISDLGFDSLDVMVIAHMINMEYKVSVQITSLNSLEDIVNQINQSK